MAKAASASATILMLVCGIVFGQTLDENKIWDANKSAVVQLRAFGDGPEGNPKNIDAGVGVIASADGYILTALHVVGRDQDWFKDPTGRVHRHVEIIRSDGVTMPPTDAVTEVVGIDDLAVVRMNGSDLPHVALAYSTPTAISDALAIVWDPTEKVPHHLRATLTNTDVNSNGDVLSVVLPTVMDGYSGSPIFDATGKVIGLIKKRLDPARALVIPIPDAIRFLPSAILSEQDNPFPSPDSQTFAGAQAAFSHKDCQASDQFLNRMSLSSQARPTWILLKARVRACMSDFEGAISLYRTYPDQRLVRDQIGEAEYQLAKQGEMREREKQQREEQARRDAIERHYADIQRRARRLNFLERYSEELAYLKEVASADPNAASRLDTEIQSVKYWVDSATEVVQAPEKPGRASMRHAIN